MAEALGIGEITLDDIISELEKPARDPREEMPRPILRTDVLDMKDLKPGMVLEGNGSEHHRFWSLCGYRRPSGRPCTYI